MLPPDALEPIQLLLNYLLWIVLICSAFLLMIIGGIMGFKWWQGEDVLNLRGIVVTLACVVFASSALRIATLIIY